MVKKIHECNKKIPIFVGGQAFDDKSNFKFDAQLITDVHELEQIQSLQRQYSDKDKARLTEQVNKADKTLLRLFFEYG